MIIHVTEDHIKRGKKHSPYECPVALAILEQIPDGYYGLLKKLSVIKTYNKSWKGIRVSNKGMIRVGMYFRKNNCPSEFIQDFDRGKPVEPFSFELEIEQ